MCVCVCIITLKMFNTVPHPSRTDINSPMRCHYDEDSFLQIPYKRYSLTLPLWLGVKCICGLNFGFINCLYVCSDVGNIMFYWTRYNDTWWYFLWWNWYNILSSCQIWVILNIAEIYWHLCITYATEWGLKCEAVIRTSILGIKNIALKHFVHRYWHIERICALGTQFSFVIS